MAKIERSLAHSGFTALLPSNCNPLLVNDLTITLPDGSQQTVAPGTRPIDVAKSISPRLAADAIVARVNGELFDLTRPLESDAQVQILTTKNPEALQVYRHSTAHLLAAS